MKKKIARMAETSTLRRTLRVLAGLAVAAGLASARPAGADEWPVAGEPDAERNLPGVERSGTLRVIRFSSDGTSPAEDQGTLLGWANAAATGTLVERRDEPAPEEALLEIVKEKPIPAR